jgi:hypothetical protein
MQKCHTIQAASLRKPLWLAYIAYPRCVFGAEADYLLCRHVRKKFLNLPVGIHCFFM